MNRRLFFFLVIDFKPLISLSFSQGSEEEILDAVAFKNPVSVAFQVTSDFQQYKSGVYSK